jgi:RNA-directed DNA polymerase
MRSTESQGTTATKLARIAWLSERDSTKVFDCLMHHFNVESLKGCYRELSGSKARGVDKIDKAQYGEHLDRNLNELVDRMKRMGYQPGPVRQVLIPKENNSNAKRPLGIGNFEDKLVQKMMQKVLESIYEPMFLKQSFGFRPNKGCHDAIKALDKYLYEGKVQTILDVDLENFFGTIDHEQLLTILRAKIKDKRFMRYVGRMLKSGILTNGELKISDEGVAQGSVVGPIYSNIFAHVVIDEWFEKVVKPHCHGQIELFRYADDMLVCCQFDRDARRIKEALNNRLIKHGLKMNQEKTKLVSFSKKEHYRGKKQQVFDFLGFTFYWGYSRKGYAILKLRTSSKKKASKLKRINAWAQQIRNRVPLETIWEMFCIKLSGHIRYYGVSHNLKQVQSYMHQAKRILFKWLNRRSQRKSFTWEQFQLFVEQHPLPKAKIYCPLF